MLAQGTNSPFQLATVTSQHNPGVRVSFDGDIDDNGANIETNITFMCVTNYLPYVNDRVLMAKVGSTWVVVGVIGPTLASGRVKISRAANVGVTITLLGCAGTSPTAGWYTAGVLDATASGNDKFTVNQDCLVSVDSEASGISTTANYRLQYNGIYADSTTQDFENFMTNWGGGKVARLQWTQFMRAGESFGLCVRADGNLTINTKVSFMSCYFTDG